jgi:hypothetical protein
MLPPVALFGIDNSGFGVAANLAVIFLIAIWLALVYWTYADARRRLEDPVLVGSAGLAALIFPFAGALVYAIVRPPESLEDHYERELDVRAAELRVRLLEQALKSGPGGGAFAATVAGELSGEPASRRPPSSGDSGETRAAGEPRQPSGAPETRAAEARPTPSRPASPAAQRGEPGPGAPTRPSQTPRPSGRPLRRPPGPDTV